MRGGEVRGSELRHWRRGHLPTRGSGAEGLSPRAGAAEAVGLLYHEIVGHDADQGAEVEGEEDEEAEDQDQAFEHGAEQREPAPEPTVQSAAESL